MIKKSFKILSQLTILAYLFTYAIAFCAYDDSGTNFDEDSFEERIIKVMVCTGIAFTLTLISYHHAKKYNAQVGHIQFVCNVLQIPIILYGISSAKTIIKSASYYSDAITKFHCNVAIIMSYIIIALVCITLLLTIYNLISCHIRKESLEQKDNYISPNSTYTRLHSVVVVVLIASVIFCTLYLYGYLAVLLIVPFIVAFALPVSILLSTEVKEWIEEKKYFRSALAYCLYAHLAYGALYRLFSDEVHGFAINFNVIKLPFDNFIPLLNFIISGIVVIILIVKGIKYRITK